MGKTEHPDSTTQASRSYRAETRRDNKRNNLPSGPRSLIDFRQGNEMESVQHTNPGIYITSLLGMKSEDNYTDYRDLPSKVLTYTSMYTAYRNRL